MKRDPVRASVLATKIIPNVAPDMAKELGLLPGEKSLALVTADCDDVTYTALDEATKQTLVPAKADKDGNRTVWALDDRGTKADYSVTATKGGDGTTVAFGFYNENNLLDADAAKFEGKVVVLEYSAKLNRNAVVGGTGNENAVTWTIGNNPQDPTSTDERTDKTHVYTSSVRIAKIDNATKAAIDGAEFGVTDKDGNKVEVHKNEKGEFEFTMPQGDVEVNVVFGCDGGDLCETHKFADIDASQWYHDPIDWALEKGYLRGYEGTNLMGPSDTTSRAQFVAMLARAAGADNGKLDGKGGTFGDVNADDWFAGVVAWGAENGIVSGYDGETVDVLFNGLKEKEEDEDA